MKTVYKGHTIEVTMKQKNGLWAADVWTWTPDQFGSHLNNWWGAEGHSSAHDAEVAGLVWAKAHIDILSQIR